MFRLTARATLLAAGLLAASALPGQEPTLRPRVPELPETVVEGEPPAIADDGGDLDLGDFTPPTEAEISSGRALDLIGRTPSASQGRFGQEDLQHRPLLRAADALEMVPGLIATQHSGSGKANQWFVRGFNLDHGTDFFLRVDGVPINLPTHGHGQGYLDINWLIPELIDYGDYKLGPYFADVGDFSSAGAVDLYLRRTLPHGIATATGGQFDYYRVLLANSQPLAGGKLLYAYESVFYNGPWDVPEDFQKFNGWLQWSIGDECEGFSLSTGAYRATWTATNQIPQSAIDAGLIGRFGSLDPSDGGETTRVPLNAQYWRDDGDIVTRANAYAAFYDLDLFSNFTFYLEDSVNGDQIEQVDKRIYMGTNLSRSYRTEYGSHTVGFQFRNDAIDGVGLFHTTRRDRLETVREDNVDQQVYALYYVNETRWLEKLRSSIGFRGDFYRFHVNSLMDPADSGTRTDANFSPKLGLVMGPWSETELFLNWGQSFHSNDARGITAAVDPANPLVKSDGSEIGVRSWLTPTWNATLACWYLELDSELIFVGDAGTTEPGPASRRFGITVTNHWQVLDWLALDADYAYVRPRYVGDARIPGAVENVVSTSMLLRQPDQPWYATIWLQSYGPAALIEDNSVRGSTTTLVNLQCGYETDRLRLNIDVFNLFDVDQNDISYFYESQPPGLPAGNYIHFHPVEPVMARATATWKF